MIEACVVILACGFVLGMVYADAKYIHKIMRRRRNP